MTITSILLENDDQPVAAPTERQTLRQFRSVCRIIRILVLVACALLAIRFCTLALGFDDDRQPCRLLMQVSYPLAAPVLDLLPEVPRLGPCALEYQSLIAILLYLILAAQLTRWGRRS